MVCYNLNYCVQKSKLGEGDYSSYLSNFILLYLYLLTINTSIFNLN